MQLSIRIVLTHSHFSSTGLVSNILLYLYKCIATQRLEIYIVRKVVL
jgi:hypothetical protein